MNRPFNPLILAMLRRQDWDKVISELEAGIIRLLKVSGNSDTLPGGVQPFDIALEAIISVWTQEREWDYIKYPNLGKFLYYSVAKSKLSHLFSSKGSKLVSRITDKTIMHDGFSDDQVYIAGKTCSELCHSFENEFHVQGLVDKIKSALGGDTIALDVFEQRMAGYKDLETVKLLGTKYPEISINDVRAATKRITRLGKKLLPKEK